MAVLVACMPACSAAMQTSKVEGMLAVDGKEVPWLLDLPRGRPPRGGYRLGLVLTHGAGGNMTTGQLPSYAEAAADIGVPCIRFTQTSPSVKIRATTMLAFLQHACELSPTLAGITHWVIGGHSKGGRASAEVVHTLDESLKHSSGGGGSSERRGRSKGKTAGCAASPKVQVVGMVLSSYPLHPPRKPNELRLEPLRSLRVPLLFLHGADDPYATPGPWSQYIPSLASKDVKVVSVPGGNHAINVKGGRKANGRVVGELRGALQAFLLRFETARRTTADATAADGAQARQPLATGAELQATSMQGSNGNAKGFGRGSGDAPCDEGADKLGKAAPRAGKRARR